MSEAIPLSQKLYLLAIHPKKGGIISSSYSAIDYVLLGSLFLELYEAGNIRFDGKKIIVLEAKSDNPIHKFLLDKLKSSSKPLRISRWINKLYFSLKHIRKMIQKELSDKRIIRMEDKRFLFFKWKRPILVKKEVVKQMLSGVEKNIFGGASGKDEIMLLSMLKPAGLMKRIFHDRHKRKKARIKLNKLMVENQVSIAVADAISAAQAVAASVAATSAATAAST